MAAIGPFAALNFAVVGISTTAGMRMTRAGGRELLLHPRHAAVVCWTGETSATVEIRDVPVSVLYEGYADLTRMTEWSPLLHSVTVDPRLPSHSVWLMRIPGALKAAARTLGYPEKVSWEADLFAPGPPSMNWTSTLDETGRLKGLPDAGGRWPRPSRGRPRVANARPCHSVSVLEMSSSWHALAPPSPAQTPSGRVLPSRTSCFISPWRPACPLAGFEPAGSVSFREVGHGMTEMTLTLRYTLPDPVEWCVPLMAGEVASIRWGNESHVICCPAPWNTGCPPRRGNRRRYWVVGRDGHGRMG